MGVEVEHRVGDAAGAQAIEDAGDERASRDRKRRLRAEGREGPKAGAKTGGQDQRGRQRRAHADANTMCGPARPRSARRAANSP